MPVTTLLLVRHGETDWNAQLRYQGHADIPLNERGRQQARELAARVAAEAVDAIYASDLSRARETGEIVAARLGLPVLTDPGLREMDVGSFEGRTHEEVAGREWDGEPREAHSKRVLRTLDRIAAAHPSARVLVVTHGGCLRRVQESLGIDAAGFENCAVW